MNSSYIVCNNEEWLHGNDNLVTIVTSDSGIVYDLWTTVVPISDENSNKSDFSM